MAGGNWNSVGTWDEGVVPVAGDAVVARAGGTSGNLTVNVASACASIILTNYTATLTFNNTLTTTSTVTFPAGMTIAGTTGTLICGAATLTSGGKTLTCALTLNAAGTYTLGDNWTANGLVTTGAASAQTINGNQITCNGGLTTGGSGSFATGGTTKFVLGGGTWSQGGSSFACDIDFNCTTLTVSGSISWATAAAGSGKTIRYVAGTITVTGSTITTTQATTWNTNGMTWATLTHSGAVTYTLSSNLAAATLNISANATYDGAGMISGSGSVLPTGTTITLNNGSGGVGLSITGTMTLPNNPQTWAGSAGWTVGTLTTAALTALRTHTLQQGNTYTVTAALSSGATPAAHQVIASSSATLKVAFVVQAGASQTLANCDATRVDSSGGGAVYSPGGVIADSINWNGSITASSIGGARLVGPGGGLVG